MDILPTYIGFEVFVYFKEFRSSYNISRYTLHALIYGTSVGRIL